MTFNTSDTASTHDSRLLQRKPLFDAQSQEIIDVLQRSAQNARALIMADACSIALLEPGKSILITYSTRQMPDEQPTSAPFRLDEGAEGWVARYQKMLLIDTPEQAEELNLSMSFPTRSLLSLPLLENGVFIGVLSAQNARTGAFDDETVRILSVFASQVAITISKLVQGARERQEAARAKNTFFSMLAHELRSPLNTINGYLELAMSGVGGELNEQQHEFVQRARVGSEHLYTLLENLLLITRADNGQIQLNRKIVQIRDVIEDAIEELELTASDQHITIQVEVANDFPRIYADAVRLQQVLRNLVTNALNFTPAGGQITICASVDMSAQNASPSLCGETDGEETEEIEEMGVLKLQVCDIGAGIASEHQPYIFERFFQATNAGHGRAGGLGLGLAIVKLLVELHGGKVVVESMPDKGSTFTCTLPCILS
ncbi:MAG: hypothetical protein PVS3B1_36540 [Ktedonobacteraceae bacterium]